MASSLLIINHGLPTGVIISFILLVSFLSVGVPVINLHQYLLHKHSLEIVDKQIQSGEIANIAQMINDAKSKIIQDRTIFQRVVSLKTLHGALMLVSWINVAGRAFVSSPNVDFQCYTTPAYKNVQSIYYNYTGPNSTTKVHLINLDLSRR